MKLGLKLLEIAITQLGVEETPRGSNAGPKVESYLASTGLGKGYSWCMAFVYWCAVEASKATRIANPLVKTAGVMRQWNECPQLRATEPKPGDIFIMDYGKGLGHTGIVEKILDDGLIRTIEGNTNDEGSREGFEVCRRIRNTKTIKGYLRI